MLKVNVRGETRSKVQMWTVEASARLQTHEKKPAALMQTQPETALRLDLLLCVKSLLQAALVSGETHSSPS